MMMVLLWQWHCSSPLFPSLFRPFLPSPLPSLTFACVLLSPLSTFPLSSVQRMPFTLQRGEKGKEKGEEGKERRKEGKRAER